MKFARIPAVETAIITTYTGRHIDVLQPEIADIHIDDIAASLAKLCRFNGHVSRTYTVAEHSILGTNFCIEANRLAFLMHDAPEAYLGDVMGPAKETSIFSEYRALEDRWWLKIASRFGLQEKLPKEVHAVDQRMRITEQRDLKGRRPQSTDAYKPFPMTLPTQCEGVEEKFLAMFYQLVGTTLGAKR